MSDQEVSQATDTRPCPCGSGKTYAECCRKIVEGGEEATTPEALVRARYSAYATRNFPFLVETTLPAKRTPEVTAEELARRTDGVEWLRLDILDSGREPDSEGMERECVDYRAYYRIGSATMQIGERSFFQRVDGKLYYSDGAQLRPAPMRRATAKVGRNDPCPCGSGKKYKKCCGRHLDN